MQLILRAIFLLSGFCYADSGVFHDGVKFFEDDKSAKPGIESSVEGQKKNVRKPFDWNKQLDPENDEFFKEGDYTPPAPFMEALRRPTKENIQLFEKWQETRNLLLSRYDAQRALYLGRDGVRLPPQPVPEQVNVGGLQKFHFKFYFKGTCPACHRMFETINEMNERGIYVEAYRVDKGDDGVQGLAIPWSSPKPADLKGLDLNAVPVLVVLDDETKKAYQLTGRMTMGQIAQAIKASHSM